MYLSFNELATMPNLVFLASSTELMTIFSVPSFRLLVKVLSYSFIE